MPVKQMLDWRCARGKRRKIFIKKENSLSGREEIVREERIRKNMFVKWRKVFTRRRMKKELVCQKEKKHFQEEE